MGTQQTIVDASSPDQIAKAIVTVNQALGLRQIGLDALWKLYYAPNHTMTRAELEWVRRLIADIKDGKLWLTPDEMAAVDARLDSANKGGEEG